jgi:hypothetical protein
MSAHIHQHIRVIVFALTDNHDARLGQHFIFIVLRISDTRIDRHHNRLHRAWRFLHACRVDHVERPQRAWRVTQYFSG